MWGEKHGSVTNVEGRVQRVGQKISPDGTPMPDWRIAAELALRLGVDFDLELVDEVQDEIARVAPAFAGVDAALLRRARDGAVLPMADHADELVLGPVSIPLTDARWEPIRPGSTAAAAVATRRRRRRRRPGARRAADADAEPTATERDDRRRWPRSTRRADRSRPARDPTSTGSPAATNATVPGRDAYALRLVTGRTLYDGGIAVAASESLAQLVPEPVLLIHPQDRDRIGVEDGASVRVTSSQGSVTLAVRADPAIMLGTAYLPFNIGDEGVGALVDVGAAVTDLRVESLS